MSTWLRKRGDEKFFKGQMVRRGGDVGDNVNRDSIRNRLRCNNIIPIIDLDFKFLDEIICAKYKCETNFLN
jgi:hypothetical protein